jgi:hypothetical protein
MSRNALKFAALLGSSRAQALSPAPTVSGNGENAGKPRLRPLHSLQALARIASAWRWLASRREAHQSSRQLHLVETLQLGDKRFVAMIEAGGARYLVGGGTGQLSLLTRLDELCEPPGAAPCTAAPAAWEQP